MIAIAVPLAYVISIPYAGLFGTACAIESYHKSSLKAGFRLMAEMLLNHNKETSKMMGFTEHYERHQREATAPRYPGLRVGGGGLGRMKEIWDNFFQMSQAEVSHALKNGWITQEEVGDLEPFLFVGVPALVTYHCVSRSLEKLGKAPRPVPGAKCDAKWPSKFNAYYTGVIVEPEGKGEERRGAKDRRGTRSEWREERAARIEATNSMFASRFARLRSAAKIYGTGPNVIHNSPLDSLRLSLSLSRR